MRKIVLYFIVISITGILKAQPTGKEILGMIDRNMTARTRIMSAKMIVNGVRGSRTIEFRTWTEGENKSFTEYTNPARERGTKMLKLEDKLWIYSPSSDRIIQITGQMLRQSVMGSDLSYEDMMDDPDLANHYSADIVGSDTVQNRNCWVLQLNALKEGEAYEVRKLWVDKEKYIPLREELYGKSGKLLKKTELSDVRKIQDRWFPTRVVYKDMLKSGNGTYFIIDDLKLDEDIPESTFSKGSLK